MFRTTRWRRTASLTVALALLLLLAGCSAGTGGDGTTSIDPSSSTATTVAETKTPTKTTAPTPTKTPTETEVQRVDPWPKRTRVPAEELPKEFNYSGPAERRGGHAADAHFEEVMFRTGYRTTIRIRANPDAEDYGGEAFRADSFDRIVVVSDRESERVRVRRTRVRDGDNIANVTEITGFYGLPNRSYNRTFRLSNGIVEDEETARDTYDGTYESVTSFVLDWNGPGEGRLGRWLEDHRFNYSHTLVHENETEVHIYNVTKWKVVVKGEEQFVHPANGTLKITDEGVIMYFRSVIHGNINKAYAPHPEFTFKTRIGPQNVTPPNWVCENYPDAEGC